MLSLWLLLLGGYLILRTKIVTGLETSSTLELLRDVHTQVKEMRREMKQCCKEWSQDAEPPLYACCAVQPSATLDTSQPRVSGLVLLRQSLPWPGGHLEAFFDLEGFPVSPNNSTRAIHVHQLGDVSKGCQAAQGHYNPLAVPHPEHPGDFGNFVVRNGRLSVHRPRLQAHLSGPYSILGRSLVVHEGQDDLGRGGNEGSLKHGNAGRRLACCTITVCGRDLWTRRAQEHSERQRSKAQKSQCKSP